MYKFFKIKITKMIMPFVLVISTVANTYLINSNLSLVAENNRFIIVEEQFNQLSIEKKNLEVKYLTVNDLNTSLNFNLSKINFDLNELRQLNKDLTQKISDLSFENEGLVESIVDLTEQIEKLNERIRVLSIVPIGGGGGSFFAPSAPSLPNTSSNLNNNDLLIEIEQLKEDLAIAIEQKTLLQNQYIQLEQLVDLLQNQILTKDDHLASFSLEIIELTSQRDTLIAQIELLISQSEENGLDFDKETELLELQTAFDALSQQLALMTSAHDQLIIDLELSQSQVITLTIEKDYFKNLYENFDVNMEALNDEIEGYSIQITELKADIENYKLQVTNLNQTINDYQLQSTVYLEQIDNLNNDILDHLSAIAELEGNKQSLLNQIQYYIDTTGPSVDFDTLNRVSQLAVKANVRIEVGNVTGSGVVYKRETVGNSHEFYILTNYHVIEKHITNNAVINVKSYAGVTKTGTLLASQFHTTETSSNRVDLAVVKVVTGPANEYYVLELAPPTYVYAGQLSFSIGNPRLQWNTVTVGNIIGSDYNIFVGGRVFTQTVMHNALIDSGNSGGALLDSDLNIIGINFAGSPQTNTFPYQSVPGYAISIDKVHIFLEENNLK